ncbi:hypothetical protein MKX66_22365 [Bacillus sp. FSL R9-9530]
MILVRGGYLSESLSDNSSRSLAGNSADSSADLSVSLHQLLLVVHFMY